MLVPSVLVPVSQGLPQCVETMQMIDSMQARGWENFKKRVKPSARSASSSKDAKGNKGSGGDGPGGRPTPPIKEMLNQLALLFGAMTLVEVVLSSMSSDRAKEINFQTFYSGELCRTTLVSSLRTRSKCSGLCSVDCLMLVFSSSQHRRGICTAAKRTDISPPGAQIFLSRTASHGSKS